MPYTHTIHTLSRSNPRFDFETWEFTRDDVDTFYELASAGISGGAGIVGSPVLGLALQGAFTLAKPFVTKALKERFFEAPEYESFRNDIATIKEQTSGLTPQEIVEQLPATMEAIKVAVDKYPNSVEAQNLGRTFGAGKIAEAIAASSHTSAQNTQYLEEKIAEGNEKLGLKFEKVTKEQTATILSAMDEKAKEIVATMDGFKKEISAIIQMGQKEVIQSLDGITKLIQDTSKVSLAIDLATYANTELILQDTQFIRKYIENKEEQARISGYVSTAIYSSRILGMLARSLGSEELAFAFETVLPQGISLGVATVNLVDSLKGSFSAAAMGNFLGAFTSFLGSVLGSSNDGMISALRTISDQISQVSKQITALHKDLFKVAQHLDQRIQAVGELVDVRTREILQNQKAAYEFMSSRFADIEGHLNKVKNLMFYNEQNIDNFRREVYLWLKELSEADYEDAAFWIENHQTLTIGGTDAELISKHTALRDEIVSWGTSKSTRTLMTGAEANIHDYKELRIQLDRGLEDTVLINTGLLKKYLVNVLGMSISSAPANLYMLNDAARTYAALLKATPEAILKQIYVDHHNDKSWYAGIKTYLNLFIGVGVANQQLLTELAAPAVAERLFSEYESAFTAVKDLLQHENYRFFEKWVRECGDYALQGCIDDALTEAFTEFDTVRLDLLKGLDLLKDGGKKEFPKTYLQWFGIPGKEIMSPADCQWEKYFSHADCRRQGTNGYTNYYYTHPFVETWVADSVSFSADEIRLRIRPLRLDSRNGDDWRAECAGVQRDNADRCMGNYQYNDDFLNLHSKYYSPCSHREDGYDRVYQLNEGKFGTSDEYAPYEIRSALRGVVDDIEKQLADMMGSPTYMPEDTTRHEMVANRETIFQLLNNGTDIYHTDLSQIEGLKSLSRTFKNELDQATFEELYDNATLRAQHAYNSLVLPLVGKSFKTIIDNAIPSLAVWAELLGIGRIRLRFSTFWRAQLHVHLEVNEAYRPYFNGHKFVLLGQRDIGPHESAEVDSNNLDRQLRSGKACPFIPVHTGSIMERPFSNILCIFYGLAKPEKYPAESVSFNHVGWDATLHYESTANIEMIRELHWIHEEPETDADAYRRLLAKGDLADAIQAARHHMARAFEQKMASKAADSLEPLAMALTRLDVQAKLLVTYLSLALGYDVAAQALPSLAASLWSESEVISLFHQHDDADLANSLHKKLATLKAEHYQALKDYVLGRLQTDSSADPLVGVPELDYVVSALQSYRAQMDVMDKGEILATERFPDTTMATIKLEGVDFTPANITVSGEFLQYSVTQPDADPAESWSYFLDDTPVAISIGGSALAPVRPYIRKAKISYLGEQTISLSEVGFSAEFNTTAVLCGARAGWHMRHVLSSAGDALLSQLGFDVPCYFASEADERVRIAVSECESDCEVEKALLTSAISDCEAEKADLETAVSDCEAEKADLETAVSDCEAEKQGLETAVNDCEAEQAVTAEEPVEIADRYAGKSDSDSSATAASVGVGAAIAGLAVGAGVSYALHKRKLKNVHQMYERVVGSSASTDDPRGDSYNTENNYAELDTKAATISAGGSSSSLSVSSVAMIAMAFFPFVAAAEDKVSLSSIAQSTSTDGQRVGGGYGFADQTELATVTVSEHTAHWDHNASLQTHYQVKTLLADPTDGEGLCTPGACDALRSCSIDMTLQPAEEGYSLSYAEKSDSIYGLRQANVTFFGDCSETEFHDALTHTKGVLPDYEYTRLSDELYASLPNLGSLALEASTATGATLLLRDIMLDQGYSTSAASQSAYLLSQGFSLARVARSVYMGVDYLTAILPLLASTVTYHGLTKTGLADRRTASWLSSVSSTVASYYSSSSWLGFCSALGVGTLASSVAEMAETEFANRYLISGLERRTAHIKALAQTIAGQLANYDSNNGKREQLMADVNATVGEFERAIRQPAISHYAWAEALEANLSSIVDSLAGQIDTVHSTKAACAEASVHRAAM